MTPASLPPEIRWLLALCRAPDTPFPAGGDADAALDALRYHRLALPLGAPVARLLPTPAQRTKAGRIHRRHLLRALRHTALIVRLSAAMRARGLPLLSFKGPAFAVAIGRSPLDRGGRDIDLLVRPRDQAALAGILRAEGFAREPGEHPWAETWRDGAADGAPARPATGIPATVIEVHTRLTDAAILPLAADDILARGVAVSLDGHPVLTLPPDLALPYAAYHGFNHAWARLFWVKDFADALAAPAGTIDWAGCWHAAERLGLQHFLGHAVALAHDVMAAPLPPGPYRTPLYRRVTPLFLPAWTVPVPSAASTEFGRFLPRRGRLRFLYWSMRLHTAPRRRLHLPVQFLTPTDADRAAFPLPRRLAALHWLLRPLRLTWTYGRRRLGPP